MLIDGENVANKENTIEMLIQTELILFELTEGDSVFFNLSEKGSGIEEVDIININGEFSDLSQHVYINKLEKCTLEDLNITQDTVA